MNLSEHFTTDEAVDSPTARAHGVMNLIPAGEEGDRIFAVMEKTAAKMELVRALLNHPIHVNSWYRCPKLNKLVGSADTSDHLKGAAVDFTCSSFGTPLEICKKLIQYQDTLGFKQLILEHTWVHISFDPDPNVVSRLQVLSLLNSGSYAVGLTDPSGKYYS
jgi:hypothetical protein